MNPILNFLQTHPLLVLDGGMATELEHRGADLHDTLWSAKILRDAPEMICDVHLDYFRAGADTAITASYQATIEGFTQRGMSRVTAIDLIQKSVHLAQEARTLYLAETQRNTESATRPTPLIAASIGPYGAYLADGSEYRGDYTLTEDELIKFHRPRMAALIAAEPDLLACETIPCLLEARALVRLLARFPNTYAWFTFTARDETHTSHGEPLAECAAYLDQFEQVAAIGINCTAPKYVPSLIKAIRSATTKPIIVYPNSGETYDPTTKTWLGETDCDAFGTQAREWYAAGARIIGGCCRTTPEHIRAIRNKGI
ncbi:MAG: homocysteine S-methyltransferase [Anaerolineales bacterium]|nr:homocysteine S-methyltransferase [Anaerolineales bacterium]